MQDLLALPGTARMNTPSTVGGNWQWRMHPAAITDELTDRLKEFVTLYNR
jgi:4-alpha-glucanotransferase